jgi:hypothetical protein
MFEMIRLARAFKIRTFKIIDPQTKHPRRNRGCVPVKIFDFFCISLTEASAKLSGIGRLRAVLGGRTV